MFGLFGVTKEANSAHGYISNFVDFFFDSIGVFGFSRGSNLVASSQWSAGPQTEMDRGFTQVHFRLSIPFETFFGTMTNEVGIVGAPSEKDAILRVMAADRFLGFSLNAYSENRLVQVAAVNPIHGRATARATMLMSRFKARGARDISEFLKGKF